MCHCIVINLSFVHTVYGLGKEAIQASWEFSPYTQMDSGQRLTEKQFGLCNKHRGTMCLPSVFSSDGLMMIVQPYILIGALTAVYYTVDSFSFLLSLKHI